MFPQFLQDSFNEYYAFWMVALVSTLVGAVSGAVGCFAVLRKQSLLGDAVSHATLPGVVLAFLFWRSKDSLGLLTGALAAGWVGTLTAMAILRTTRIKTDTALGTVLSVYYGFGIVLLAYCQRHVADAQQAGIDKALLGQAAVSILWSDLITIGVLGGAALVLLLAFWKEFKLLSFDPDYAASLGWPVRLLDVLLTTLLVVGIVVGLQTVGVVLMSAMLVAPAAAARQWTDRLGRMVVLAAFFGAAGGTAGGLIASFARVPAGPAIILCVSALVVFSILAAPNHGLVWNWLRDLANRRRLRIDAVLADLYLLAGQHANREHGHPVAVLQAMSVGRSGLDRSLDVLAERGLVRQVEPGSWALTREGLAEAERQSGQRENG